MAVTLTLTDVDPGTTQLYAFGTVTLSGTYPTGGDTLDWTQLAKQIAGRGQTVFPIYGASGGIAASFIFYFDTGFQVWNESPRSGSFIDSLARPSGY